MEWKFIADIDLPWDDTNELWHQMLERLSKACPSAHIQLSRFVGSGGGWPQGSVIIHSKDVKAFAEFFGHDDDLDFFLESIDNLPG
jgi:hypothetical protein